MGRQDISLLENVEVEVVVVLGRTRLPVRELLALDAGAVVTLDRFAGEPLDVEVDGVVIAHGEVVVVDGRFGVRITEVCPVD